MKGQFDANGYMVDDLRNEESAKQPVIYDVRILFGGDKVCARIHRRGGEGLTVVVVYMLAVEELTMVADQAAKVGQEAQTWGAGNGGWEVIEDGLQSKKWHVGVGVGCRAGRS